MIENKSKRRPAPGDHFETKDADWATTDEEWEAAGLTRVRRTDAAKRATSDGKVTSSSDQRDADTLARMIADRVKIGRRAREIVGVQRRVNEIVGDAHTMNAINAAERHGAISRDGARRMRRDVVMKRRAR